MTDGEGPTIDDVEDFLASHHGAPVGDLRSLRGGFWSSAYAYDVGDRGLVLRLGKVREGFEATACHLETVLSRGPLDPPT